jgi:hypothetical protein
MTAGKMDEETLQNHSIRCEDLVEYLIETPTYRRVLNHTSDKRDDKKKKRKPYRRIALLLQ